MQLNENKQSCCLLYRNERRFRNIYIYNHATFAMLGMMPIYSLNLTPMKRNFRWGFKIVDAFIYQEKLFPFKRRYPSRLIGIIDIYQTPIHFSIHIFQNIIFVIDNYSRSTLKYVVYFYNEVHEKKWEKLTVWITLNTRNAISTVSSRN